MDKAKVKKFAVRGLIGLGALAVLIQLVPYGCNHTNPPVTQEAPWSSPTVRNLAVRACYDCHSNATVWPWYSHIAPLKWLVQRDVDDGRRQLNFSEWDKPQRGAHEAAEELEGGDMPLWFYLPLHGDAKLSDGEKSQLETELKRLAGTQAGEGKGGEGGEKHEGGDDD